MYSAMITRFLLFFFFSSRRRHTRCLSDWSSDVCSSDLDQPQVVEDDRDHGRRRAGGRLRQRERSTVERLGVPWFALPSEVLAEMVQRRHERDMAGAGRTLLRSEERRVGKGGRVGG